MMLSYSDAEPEPAAHYKRPESSYIMYMWQRPARRSLKCCVWPINRSEFPRAVAELQNIGQFLKVFADRAKIAA